MPFSASDIRAGDVLLLHGRGFVSWAIREFDGTEVNHAAIALDGGQLGEAAGSGLRRRGVAEALATNDFTIVRRLGASPDMAPVLARAAWYLDGRVPYAYQQIVLLAILAATRKIPMPALARRLVRSVLDHAAAALNSIVDSGAQSMICSEFVYRAYEEAVDTEPNPYALSIALARALAVGAQTAGGTPFAIGGGGAHPDSFLSWALRQPPQLIDSAAAAGPSRPLAGVGAPSIADAEAEIAPLIAEYAQAVAPEGPEVRSLAPAVFAAMPVGIAVEPTDEEFLSSMIALSLALDRSRLPKTPQPSAGAGAVGSLVVRGELQGLLDISADPNFVTPGDLLKTQSLQTQGKIP